PAGRVQAKLWDVATGRPLLDVGNRDAMTGLAFAPTGQQLAVSSIRVFGPPGVDVWRVENGRGLQNLRGLSSQVAQVRFSPDGKRIAALAHNWQVGIWEVLTGRLEYVLDVPQGGWADNAGFVFSADGRQFAFSAGREAKRWDLSTGKELNRWPLPPGLVDHLGFNGTDKLLLFRVETKDGRLLPASDAPAKDHPRVGRIRDLFGPDPTQPITEIEDFNWCV